PGALLEQRPELDPRALGVSLFEQVPDPLDLLPFDLGEGDVGHAVSSGGGDERHELLTRDTSAPCFAAPARGRLGAVAARAVAEKSGEVLEGALITCPAVSSAVQGGSLKHDSESGPEEAQARALALARADAAEGISGRLRGRPRARARPGPQGPNRPRGRDGGGTRATDRAPLRPRALWVRGADRPCGLGAAGAGGRRAPQVPGGGVALRFPSTAGGRG